MQICVMQHNTCRKDKIGVAVRLTYTGGKDEVRSTVEEFVSPQIKGSQGLSNHVDGESDGHVLEQ